MAKKMVTKPIADVAKLREGQLLMTAEDTKGLRKGVLVFVSHYRGSTIAVSTGTAKLYNFNANQLLTIDNHPKRAFLEYAYSVDDRFKCALDRFGTGTRMFNKFCESKGWLVPFNYLSDCNYSNWQSVEQRVFRSLGYYFVHYQPNKGFFYFKSLREATFGLSKVKRLSLHDMKVICGNDRIANDFFTDAEERYANETKPLAIMVKTPTFKLFRMLSSWHVAKRVTSCMLNTDGDYANRFTILASARFYRRFGFKVVLISDDNDLIARVIIDGNGNYTRIYSIASANLRRITSQLAEHGYNKADSYIGAGYIRLHDNEQLLIAPYIDGNHSVIMGNRRIAKNGRKFVHAAFGDDRSTDVIDLDSPTAKVALEDNIKCESCGDVIHRDDAYETNYDTLVCESCYDD